MTEIRLPTTDARIEQGVRAGLMAAALAASDQTREYAIEAYQNDAGRLQNAAATYACDAVREAICALAADPDAVARIAKWVE